MVNANHILTPKICGDEQLKDMIDVHEKVGGNVIGVADVAKEDTSKYGILDPESDDGKMIKF